MMFLPRLIMIFAFISGSIFINAGPLGASDKTGREALTKTQEERKDRRQYFRVYGGMLGIYDDVLDETTEGPRTLQEALRAPDWLRLAFQHRTRYETLDGRWRLGEHGSDQQVAQRTRFLFNIREIFDPLRAVVELQDSRVHATDADSFVDDMHVNKLDVLQLHLDLVSDDFLGTGLPTLFAAGRLTMGIGSGRWIGRNTFRNTTNAFDGFQWSVGDRDRDMAVEVFLVRPVRIFPTTLDPTLPNQHHTFWGLHVGSYHHSWLNVGLYYFGHSSELAHRDFTMVGARLWKPGKPGEYEFEIESAYQTGDISPQGRFEHFQHGETGYTFDAAWKPQLLVRMDYASAGFDDLYGRRNFELTATGIFGPFTRTNIISPGYRVLALPRKSLYIFVQHRAWWLADATAAWAGSNLRDPTGSSGRYLGQTVELRARWGATDNVFLQAGYVYFNYGTFVHQVPGGPSEDDSNYGFVSAELIF